MPLTIIRHQLPPWAKKRWPDVMEMPEDWREGSPLPKRWSIDLRSRRERELEYLLRRRAIRGGSTAAAYMCQNNPFAATAGAKTALLVAAPAGHGLTVSEASISFDGVTASAVPALVDIVRKDGTTAGTAGASPVAAIQTRGRVTAGSGPTVTHNYTAEPTVLTGGRQWYVSPNGGLLVYPFPLGRETETDSSAGTIKFVGIRVAVTANVNALCYMEVEALG